MELPVPTADKAALQRAQVEEDSYHRPGVLTRSMSLLKGGPDTSHAARSGQPTLTAPKATIPASVPVAANSETATATGGATGTTDVSATEVTGPSKLDTNPDARTADTTAKPETPAAVQQPLPTNRDADLKKLREQQAKKQAKLDKKRKKKADTAPDNPPPAAGVPAAAQSPSGTPASASNPPASTPPSANPPDHP